MEDYSWFITAEQIAFSFGISVWGFSLMVASVDLLEWLRQKLN